MPDTYLVLRGAASRQGGDGEEVRGEERKWRRGAGRRKRGEEESWNTAADGLRPALVRTFARACVPDISTIGISRKIPDSHRRRRLELSQLWGGP